MALENLVPIHTVIYSDGDYLGMFLERAPADAVEEAAVIEELVGMPSISAASFSVAGKSETYGAYLNITSDRSPDDADVALRERFPHRDINIANVSGEITVDREGRPAGETLIYQLGTPTRPGVVPGMDLLQAVAVIKVVSNVNLDCRRGSPRPNNNSDNIIHVATRLSPDLPQDQRRIQLQSTAVQVAAAARLFLPLTRMHITEQQAVHRTSVSRNG